MASVDQAWVKALCLGLLLASVGLDAVAQQDAVQTRRAAMKANGQALMRIDRIIRNGSDPAEVVELADGIAAVAGRIPGLFPPGRGKGDDGAKPAIWQKFGDFQAKAANLQEQAALLAAAAQAGDPATIRAQYDMVVHACADCHMPYRHQRW